MVRLTIEIKTKPRKEREFLLVLQGFQSSPGLIDCLRKESGCLIYQYQIENHKKDGYKIESDWRTLKDLNAHFKSHYFKVLLGAIRVLCRPPKMKIFDGKRTTGMEALQGAWEDV